MTDAQPKNDAPVLLLDDNLMTSARLVNILKANGYPVVLARQLPDAQSTLTGINAPQLIVINLGSRSIDGLALFQAAQSTFPSVPVAGFCGHLEIEIRRAAKAAGIHYLMTNEQAGEQLLQILAQA